jgi:hypothetical protein
VRESIRREEMAGTWNVGLVRRAHLMRRGLLTAHLATEVNSCAMKYYLCRRQHWFYLGVLKHQHLYFCKRNFRTPARVNNVIMSAWIIVRSGTLDVTSGEFLSSRVFYLRLLMRPN